MAASIWRGRITFGLVSIPVRLVKAARRERTRFRRVQPVRPEDATVDEDSDVPDIPVQPSKILNFPPAEEKDFGPGTSGHLPLVPNAEETVVRVRNAPVSGLTEEPVQRTEILKGYEVAKDEYVVLAPEEVAALRPRTSSELEIESLVKVGEIDPVYYETSYYVVPEAGGERAYALLFATLKETGHAGMGSLAMHGREHVALIRAGEDTLCCTRCSSQARWGTGVVSSGAGCGEPQGTGTREEVGWRA